MAQPAPEDEAGGSGQEKRAEAGRGEVAEMSKSERGLLAVMLAALASQPQPTPLVPSDEEEPVQSKESQASLLNAPGVQGGAGGVGN